MNSCYNSLALLNKGLNYLLAGIQKPMITQVKSAKFLVLGSSLHSLYPTQSKEPTGPDPILYNLNNINNLCVDIHF